MLSLVSLYVSFVETNGGKSRPVLIRRVSEQTVEALIARGHIRETEKRVPFSLDDKVYEFKVYRFDDQGLTAEKFKINI